MSVMQLPNGRWRVQLRRKGYPPFDKVFATEREARAKDKAVRHEMTTVLSSEQLTVIDVWDRYSKSFEYQGKADHTRLTEASRIKPVLHTLGAYSLSVLERLTTQTPAPISAGVSTAGYVGVEDAWRGAPTPPSRSPGHT